MKKLTIFLAFLLFVSFQVAAQMQITGKVTGAEDGLSVPGVSVVVKDNTTIGTTTNVDGEYSLTVPGGTEALVFSFIGMKAQEVLINGRSVIDVQMEAEILEMDAVVITALGISREKKSLGYAVQEIGGDEVSTVKSENFINALSGKVSGVQIKSSGNMGGSTNIIIRGSTSLTGNNQAMFVIDGVPVNNDINNSDAQTEGGTGYDYGNAASDINPDDIKSMSILKGAAATALYGSRAANGVIIITTKKGEDRKGKKGIGVTVNSTINAGTIDKSTFPTYQDKYGAGYGDYYYGDAPYGGLHSGDVNGDGTDDLFVPFYEDASRGQEFDPSLMVYQWGAFDPESPTYMQATPWVAAENGPETFFETAMTYTNSIAIASATDVSSFRIAYTNMDQSGIMPNSSLKRNTLAFNGSFDVSDNITASANATYTNTNALGRNGTGYGANYLAQWRQWWQVNVDIKELENAYNTTGRNVTWNRNWTDDGSPAYWDNPYWTRYENYQTDTRDRLLGAFNIDWKLTDYLKITGRASIDQYSEIQEERKMNGSHPERFGISRLDVGSGYARTNRIFRETNYDLMANYNKNITEDISLTVLLGTNLRKTQLNSVFSSTNGGLIVPGLFSIENSVNPVLTPVERDETVAVNGIYGDISLGFKDFIFLEGTLRRDQASTLPEENNTYYYPAISGNLIFTKFVDASWLSFGKIRANYAEVGNMAPWGSIKDVYTKPPLYGSIPLYSVGSTKNNADLKPERTKSLEGGLEMVFYNKRLGFDLALYKTNTVDQIMPVSVSRATGYSFKYVNSGEIQNSGVELMIYGTPYVNNDFRWDVNVNWSKNTSEVISLFTDEAGNKVTNLVLGDFQGGVTINATVGQPYGTIQGVDYVRHENGEPIVLSNGYYQKTTTSDNVIGNVNPDWKAGINNKFSYKNLALSFLIDISQGGDVFSLDQWYGLGTGLYEETAGNNDLGNPLRDPIVGTPGNYDATSGGKILDGVLADGTPNNIRIPGNNYRADGWARFPNTPYVYDASYVKLREVVLTYNLPDTWMDKTFIADASLSFVGSNLWIIHKNLPYADPEATTGAGNLQGWQSGVMPTVRNFGFNIKLQF